MTDRFFRPGHVSAFRTLAAVSWDAPLDPTIYGSTEIEAGPLKAWLDQVRATTGQKVTYTHAVARAVAATLAENPELNCTLRRGRLWQRRDVDIFCQVAVPHEDGTKLQGADLSGAVLRKADAMSTVELAKTLDAIAARIRQRKDPELQKIKRTLESMPAWMAKSMMRLLSWLSHDWGMDLRSLGVPNDPFGSIMVTSLGMFGIRHAYAPLFPAAKGLGVILVGGVYDGIVAVDGKAEVRSFLPLSIALDHRLIDGFQASVLARGIITRLRDPSLLDPAPTLHGAAPGAVA